MRFAHGDTMDAFRWRYEEDEETDVLGPQRMSEVVTISIIQPPVADVFSGDLGSL